MVDTIRTEAELQTIFADNTSGDISAQDGRDLIVTALRQAKFGTGYPIGINERQFLDVTGDPTGGTFTLVFSGQTTAAIAWNAPSLDVQTALEALSNIGAGNVLVLDDGNDLPDGEMAIIFQGALAATDVAQITLGTNSLTGGSSPTVTITTSDIGTAAVAGTRVAELRFDTLPDEPGLWFNVGAVAVPDWRKLQSLMGVDSNGHVRAELTVSDNGLVQFTTLDELGRQVANLDASQVDLRIEFWLEGAVTAALRMNDEGVRMTRTHIDGTVESRVDQVAGGLTLETARNGAAVLTSLTGTVDPTAGAGIVAAVPAMYLRANGAATEIWRKTGAGDTAWTQVT